VTRSTCDSLRFCVLQPNSELTRALDNSAKLMTRVWSSRDATSHAPEGLSKKVLSLLLCMVAC